MGKLRAVEGRAGLAARAQRTKESKAGIAPDPERIADDIIASQQGEIDQMLAWREEWFGSRELGPVLPEVLGLSESELGMEHGSADEITDADDVDATVAAMMVPHHEGGDRDGRGRGGARGRNSRGACLGRTPRMNSRPSGAAVIRVHSPIAGMARFGHRTWRLKTAFPTSWRISQPRRRSWRGAASAEADGTWF